MTTPSFFPLRAWLLCVLCVRSSPVSCAEGADVRLLSLVPSPQYIVTFIQNWHYITMAVKNSLIFGIKGVLDKNEQKNSGHACRIGDPRRRNRV